MEIAIEGSGSDMIITQEKSALYKARIKDKQQCINHQHHHDCGYTHWISTFEFKISYFEELYMCWVQMPLTIEKPACVQSIQKL